MTFAPDDIEIKEFVPTMRGYDRNEVRAFLRAVAEDVRRLEDRLTERAMMAMQSEVATAPIATAEASTSSRLEDAIRDLTVAVQSLTIREAAPVSVAPSAPAVASVASSVTPSTTMPNETRTAAATVTPPEPGEPRRTETASVVELPKREIETSSQPPITTEVRKSTWDGIERRSAKRPWSGSNKSETKTEPAHDIERGSTAEKSKHVPRHFRSSENQSLISRFLHQALDHRAKTNTASATDEIVNKHLLVSGEPQLHFASNPSGGAPSDRQTGSAPPFGSTHRLASETEHGDNGHDDSESGGSEIPTNVVPLMRAV
jgi:DivIVA domain-containing protein